MIKIYRMTFADGCVYVGQTRRSVKARISAHRTRPCNAALHERLFWGQIYETEILSRHHKQRRADLMEHRAIMRVPVDKRINVQSPVAGKIEFKKQGIEPISHKTKARMRPRTRRYEPRRDEKFICSLCRKKKQGTEFYASTSRFNGLDSRCKECRKHTDRRMRESVRAGGTTSDGYWKAKRELKAE